VRVEYIPLGGAGEVGASCGILRIGDWRVLIDAGMRPSARAGQDRRPALDRLTAEPPDAILVTHAHIDHTGALPLASEMVPTAPIYCTETTLLLTRLLLADSVRVMEAEHLAQEGETPLYTAIFAQRTEKVKVRAGHGCPLFVSTSPRSAQYPGVRVARWGRRVVGQCQSPLQVES